MWDDNRVLESEAGGNPTMRNMRRKTKEPTTRKAVKVIGHKRLIDPDTGHFEDTEVITVEERDANFHKIWLGHVLQSLDLIGNQKTRLAFWILDNLDAENRLVMTYRKISIMTGVSLETVRRTMKALQDANFLQIVQRGVYRVNPDCVFKGGKCDRMNVMIQYRKTAEENSGNGKVVPMPTSGLA